MKRRVGLRLRVQFSKCTQVAISYLLFEIVGDPSVFHDTIPKFSRHLVTQRQMFKFESGAKIRNPFALDNFSVSIRSIHHRQHVIGFQESMFMLERPCQRDVSVVLVSISDECSIEIENFDGLYVLFGQLLDPAQFSGNSSPVLIHHAEIAVQSRESRHGKSPVKSDSVKSDYL